VNVVSTTGLSRADSSLVSVPTPQAVSIAAVTIVANTSRVRRQLVIVPSSLAADCARLIGVRYDEHYYSA
jgi:hypothetical protein